MDAEERQEARDNEIEALKSIYGDDFEASWAPMKDQPFTFRVLVTPAGGLSPDEIHAAMKLEFVLGKKYPNQPPTIRNHKIKGLADDLLKQILSQLRKSAKKQKGEVMVHELIMEAQEFLVQHNKELKPFHEQMLDHQTAITKEKEKKEAKERQETIKRDKMQKVSFIELTIICIHVVHIYLFEASVSMQSVRTTGVLISLWSLQDSLWFGPTKSLTEFLRWLFKKIGKSNQFFRTSLVLTHGHHSASGFNTLNF